MFQGEEPAQTFGGITYLIGKQQASNWGISWSIWVSKLKELQNLCLFFRGTFYGFYHGIHHH